MKNGKQMKETEFIPIDKAQWARREYFEYFYEQIKCKYTLTVNLDITQFHNRRVQKGLKFFPSFLYPIMKAVNNNKEFRMNFVDNTLGYWNYSHPSYTIFHEDTETFSDVWSEYDENFEQFYQNIITDMTTYKDVYKVKAKLNQPPNFCSISSLPWLSFTAFSQDTYTESNFLLPLIRFGKYFEDGHKLLIPFAVFVSHAVADGYHTSKLINEVQDLLNRVDEWM